jgi:hypothetical protein
MDFQIYSVNTIILHVVTTLIHLVDNTLMLIEIQYHCLHVYVLPVALADRKCCFIICMNTD